MTPPLANCWTTPHGITRWSRFWLFSLNAHNAQCTRWIFWLNVFELFCSIMCQNQGVHTMDILAQSFMIFLLKPRFPPPWTSQPTSVWSCTTVARTRGWSWAARLLVRQVCWEECQSWWHSGILANHIFWPQTLMIDYLKTRHWSCQEGRRTRPLGSLRQAFSKFRHHNIYAYLYLSHS